MTGTTARPRFGNGAFEARPRPGVHQLLRLRLKIVEQLLLVAEKTPIELGVEFSAFWRDLAGMRWAPFAKPFLQTAVEHLDLAMAERQEHPPRPRCCDPRPGIIGHNRIIRRNAEL